MGHAAGTAGGKGLQEMEQTLCGMSNNHMSTKADAEKSSGRWAAIWV